MNIMFFILYFHCRYNSTYAKTPYVDQGPILYMFNDSNLYSLNIERGGKSTSLMGIDNPNRLFSLEFSIDHCLEIDDYSLVDADKLKFKKIELTLKKYFKMKPNAVYDEKAHGPKEIPLPDMNTDLFGFKLYISPFSYRIDSQRLKKGCQLIALYFEIEEGEIVNHELMKNIVRKFKQFINVLPPESDEMYCGFKFIIKMTNLNESNTEVVFTSNMFRFMIYNYLGYISVKEVDEREYHI